VSQKRLNRAQVKQLRDAGAEKVFRETASGARSDRAQLRRALAELGKGDVLMVMRRFYRLDVRAIFSGNGALSGNGDV
jgi:hypothetical protein